MPRRGTAARIEPAKKDSFPGLLDLVGSGDVLATRRASTSVFRAAVLSIVLTFAVGPSASVLCRAWCDPQSASSTGCSHNAPADAPSIGDNNNCEVVVTSVAAVRQDERRGMLDPGVDQSTLVSRYHLASSVADLRTALRPAHARLLEHRPLVTTLRI
jgi:hypothetical protein